MSLSIAMDGPVGAGKSSIADAVAKRLGILHLDTGAMYRAVGVMALREKIAEDEQEVSRKVQDWKVDVRYVTGDDGEGRQHTFICGEDVTAYLREEATGKAASKVATYPAVRRAMVETQQRLAAEQDMLLDGRDIGTRVLPSATVKIYLTASDEVRARRRLLQLQEQNPGENVCFETVLEDLRKRDEQDMNRETDPLRQAEDAILVDSSFLTFDETVETILRHVSEKRAQA